MSEPRMHWVRLVGDPGDGHELGLVRRLGATEWGNWAEIARSRRPFPVLIDDTVRETIRSYAEDHDVHVELGPVVDPRQIYGAAGLRYLGGGSRIHVLRVLRASLGLPLRRLRPCVDDQQILWLDRSPYHAEQLLEQLEQLGARVEIVVERARYFAFDPWAPAGEEPTMERWHVTEDSLCHERGWFGAWETVSCEQFDDRAELDATLEHHLDQIREQEWEVVDDPFEVMVRRGASNPRRERAVRMADDPDPAGLALVRWLTEQGDPRGPLGMAQREGIDPAASLREHAASLLGPLHSALDNLTLRWSGGVVSGLKLGSLGHLGELHDQRRAMLRMLRLPLLSCLRSLEVGPSAMGTTNLAELLADAPLEGLRQLTIASIWTGTFDATRGWDQLPNLRQLKLIGAPRLGPLRLPRLRSLKIGRLWLDPASVRAFADGQLGSLEALDLGFRWGLHWMAGSREVTVPSDELDAFESILGALEGSPLRTLNIDSQVGGPMAELLCRSPVIRRLERLSVTFDAITIRAKNRFAEQPGLARLMKL